MIDIARTRAGDGDPDRLEQHHVGAYRFRPATSYVMVLSRDGRVLFRHAGVLPSRDRMRFLQAIGDEKAQRG